MTSVVEMVAMRVERILVEDYCACYQGTFCNVTQRLVLDWRGQVEQYHRYNETHGKLEGREREGERNRERGGEG